MDFTNWIGRTERREETISERQISLFQATFPGLLADFEVPPGFHWTMVPDLAEPNNLGRDGHPKPGIFMPDLGLPRRMWAGGMLEYLAPLRVGDEVARDSRIADVVFKEGSTGRLGFVTVEHTWSAGQEVCIRERQDIVYREEPKSGAAARVTQVDDWKTDASAKLTPDPVLLFRYSALTFNGHRIHYDFPYATEVEGYEGLVVHGPMQSMLMQNLAAKVFGSLPKRFEYRGLSPLICGHPITIEARAITDGLELRVHRVNGPVTMSATAIF